MIVSKKAKRLYNKIFDGTETAVANAIQRFQSRRILRKCVKHMPKLTSEQKKKVKTFWKPYCRVKMNWFRYYTYVNGTFDPRYIPDDLYFTKIDQYFNARKLGYGFCDKNYYSRIFKGFKQPTTVIRKIGFLLFDENYCQIDIEKAEELLSKRAEVIAKPSQESGSARDIKFFDTKTKADELKQLLLDKNQKDIIIQDIVKQHPDLGKMHPQSLNTIRISTIMLDDGVHVLLPFLRMGANDCRVDNVSAYSGVTAEIKENGQLADRGFFDVYSGKTTDKHPQGMKLSEIRVPSLDKLVQKAKQAAQCVGNFRLVGWDFSVDEDGEPVLIEGNMRKNGAITVAQNMHGPFFGDITEKVLDEVFGRNQK